MSDAATSEPPTKRPRITINRELPLGVLFNSCTRPPHSLDPEESPGDLLTEERFAAQIKFGNGEYERNAWLKNLHLIEMPYKQQQAFRTCGTCPMVMHDPETDRFRLQTQTCKSRFCPACRKQRQFRWIRTITHALKHLPTAPWKLITLTQRHTNEPLKQQLDKLRKSFRRLRQTGFWKKHVQWGIAVLEVSYNGETNQWHPHLHLLAPCGYIDYTELRKCWLKATGDSHILDVKQVRNANHAVSYLAKYLGKPPSAAIFHDPKRLNDYYLALSHAKMLLPFGQFPDGAKAPKPERSATNWIQIGRLSELLSLARRHYEPAQLILKRLQHRTRDAQQTERTLFDGTFPHDITTATLDPPDP